MHFIQENLINLGLKLGLDVSLYSKNVFNIFQMNVILLGLKYGLDVSKYNNPEYNWKQMNEIMIGLLHGVDVDKYNNIKYRPKQMEQIRIGLEQGLDISLFNDTGYDSSYMEYIRLKRIEYLIDKSKSYFIKGNNNKTRNIIRDITIYKLEDDTYRFDIGNNIWRYSIVGNRKFITKETFMALIYSDSELDKHSVSRYIDILDNCNCLV